MIAANSITKSASVLVFLSVSCLAILLATLCVESANGQQAVPRTSISQSTTVLEPDAATEAFSITAEIAVSAAREECPATSEEAEIVEAVYRYQFRQHSLNRDWNVFYLAFGWLGDSGGEKCVDARVDAFRDHAPPVRKFRRDEYDAERIRKERGLVVGVAEIKKTDTEAEVEGFSFALPGEAQGYRYYLVRENGRWIVKSSKTTWTA